MKLELDKPLVFFDIEATGSNSAVDRIVEISLIKLMPDGQTDTKSYRINPEQPIPDAVANIIGITNEDVRKAPTFDQVAQEIAAFLEGSDLAGFYSNNFDVPMLVEEFLRADVHFDTDERNFIDVFRIYTKKEKRDLPAAYKFYCKKVLTDHHASEADARATMEILLAQLERYDDLSTDTAGLANYSKDKDFVDLGRRMIYQNGEPVFNFGKFKGKKVRDVLNREPQYFDWMMKGDFHLHTKQKLKEIRESSKQPPPLFKK